MDEITFECLIKPAKCAIIKAGKIPGMYGETRILNLHCNIGTPIFYDVRQAFLVGRRKS